MSNPVILVVDDDQSALQALMQVLRKENYQVEGASSGTEALQKAEQLNVDLVITDIRMEHMDGMELMRALHARMPPLPVIVMTAFASIDTAIRSIHEGACDYISKPYEVDELRLTVRRALEQPRRIGADGRAPMTLNTSRLLTTPDSDCLESSESASPLFSGDLVSLNELERLYAAHVISRCSGNMFRASEILQIDRRTLYRMLSGLPRETCRKSIDHP